VTVLALAEHVKHCLAERADEIRKDANNRRVTYTAIIGKQCFRVTVEELAKDAVEPAIT
jgi:hypothetical protein